MVILTKEDAEIIADKAEALKTCNTMDSTGYYILWQSDEDEDVDVSVDINKREDDGKMYYAIFISHYGEESKWDYTETLDRSELINKLFEIADAQ